MARITLVVVLLAVMVTSMAPPAVAEEVTAKRLLLHPVYCDPGTLDNCRNTPNPAMSGIQYDCVGQVHGTITCSASNGIVVKVTFQGQITDPTLGITIDKYSEKHKIHRCRTIKKHHHRHHICIRAL